MASIRCALCNQPLRAADVGAGGIGTCASCRRSSMVVAFPALVDGGGARPPVLPDDPPGEGEAACFYSPNRRATKECSHCGALISSTWAAQWGSDTVCLKCLDHLRLKGKDERFQGSRVLWDNVALILALVPFSFILYWAAFFTAPAALFIGLRHWNSPRSLVPRSRARMVIALVLAFLQVGGMVFMAMGLIFGWFRAFKT